MTASPMPLIRLRRRRNKTAELVKAYEMGVENDISKVMINQQVSSLGFQLTLNVRNKVLSAYKDIMNMPVYWIWRLIVTLSKHGN